MRTCVEEALRAQEADGEPHDGGFVQVSADVVRQRQLVSQLVENFRFFAAARASGVARLLLTTLRAVPVRHKRQQTRRDY